jgi:UDP-GlcNAc:undecaprenyl-phosphate GlcNAc-1-phosphate transferase
MLGLIAGCLTSGQLNSSNWILLLLLSTIPAFGFGLLEDVTKKIGPLIRLLATFLAAALAFFLNQATLTRIGIPIIDTNLANYIWLSLIFTMIAVGGLTHAFNLIDGYNGLSGMVAILIFSAIAYVSLKVDDMVIMSICLIMIGSILGFLFWNFPRGLIFAGDGGAYLVGFMIAEVSVLMVARNPAVSPWFPMLCVIYPVFETLFTIYRRKFVQRKPVGQPDALHLHQMIYCRMVRWMTHSRESQHMTQRNSLTSPYLWLLCIFSVVPAAIFWDKTYALLTCAVLFIFLYIYIYRLLIRFQTPRWLRLQNPKRHYFKT